MTQPRRGSRPGPATPAGQLLRAALLGELDTRAATEQFVSQDAIANLDELLDPTRVAAELTPEVVDSVMVLAHAFGVLVRRRFAPGQDARAITRYITQARDRGALGQQPGQARYAEALIRSALGEPGLADGIPADQAGATVSYLLFDLARSMDLTATDIDAVLVEAEQLLR
jgi:hypothetical protein